MFSAIIEAVMPPKTGRYRRLLEDNLKEAQKISRSVQSRLSEIKDEARAVEAKAILKDLKKHA